jgi:hypothetical protein
MIDLAGDPAGLLGARHCPGEVTQLDEARGEPIPRPDGHHGAARRPFVPPILLKRLHAPAEVLDSLPIVSFRLPDRAEAVANQYLEGLVVVANGDGQSPMAQLERLVGVPCAQGPDC